MSDLKPSEQELQAAAMLFAPDGAIKYVSTPETPIANEFRARKITQAATIIARHTRYSGMTAKEWADLCQHRMEQRDAAESALLAEQEAHSVTHMELKQAESERAAYVRRYERAELAADFERLNKLETELARVQAEREKLVAVAEAAQEVKDDAHGGLTGNCWRVGKPSMNRLCEALAALKEDK